MKKPSSKTSSLKSHALESIKGKGDELHQVSNETHPPLTTQQGIPVSDDQNSLKIGASGPVLMEDFPLREKLFHFDHERIPERVVHARGFGAHGFFETYESLSDITSADIFQRAHEKTPAFVRFSTVAGNKGSSDLARDVRGFAVKLYTKQGNFDIVGNNMPVFFIQDAIKFPDLIHSAKQEPDRGFPQAQTAHDNFWDFISLMPESMHMAMWIMSDRAIPRSFRFMEGFGVHTFRLVTKEGKSTYVKFHWKPKQGLQSVLWDEAVKINGADPDFHRRDLWNSIQSGSYPEWELGLQLFDDAFADTFDFDILDATKFIPEELVPIRYVGRLVLDRCVDNFFAETEQVAFCTANIVPGIDFTNDPLLQGRNFSYLDTQIKRLGGPNFTHIPINAPKCPFHHFQQDGHMAMHNPKGRINYEPNSSTEPVPRESPKDGFRSFPAKESGQKLRERSEKFADHYSQARQFYISQTKVEQQHIADSLIFELSKVENPKIRMRLVSHLPNIEENLSAKVAAGLGIKEKIVPCEHARKVIKDLKPSRALSILLNPPKNFSGRKVGIIVTDGINDSIFESLIHEIEKEKATFEIIALTIGGVKTEKEKEIKAHQSLKGAPSVLYDAVIILSSSKEIAALTKHPAARQFVTDAFNHLKSIGFSKESKPLFDKACVTLSEGCLEITKAEDAHKFILNCRSLRFWNRKV